MLYFEALVAIFCLDFIIPGVINVCFVFMSILTLHFVMSKNFSFIMLLFC